MNNKVLLVIFDGFGQAPAGDGNAIALARTPTLDSLFAKHPHSLLQASGEAVGVVEGVMGSSEIGHFTMGAGRVVPQFLLAINQDIESGAFFEKPPLKNAFQHARENSKKLHLLGMISDKGVHAHINHLLALLEMAKKEEVSEVYIHAIADGRDVKERSVKKYLTQLQDKMDSLGVGKIATLIGRYYTMDRDTNWDRTEKGYRLMTLGEGERAEDPLAAVDHFYATDPKAIDQYMTPFLIDEKGLIEDGDAVIFFNYRTDRPRQITSAFVDSEFPHFERTVKKIHFTCMGPYSQNAPVAYDTPVVKNNLGSWLAQNKVTQLRVAETEKYAHVTYFFNSQEENPNPLEDRLLVNSPKIATHDEKPELAAPQITQTLIEAMQKGEHQVIIANYANADLVGHTGLLQPTIKAVEALDQALEKLVNQAQSSGYTLLLTGDHGNAEEMLFEDGSPRPSHTINPVPLLLVDPENRFQNLENGGLADVAPTLLKLLNLPQPEEMTGKALF